jgi:hypothetical protein
MLAFARLDHFGSAEGSKRTAQYARSRGLGDAVPGGSCTEPPTGEYPAIWPGAGTPEFQASTLNFVEL